MDKLQAAGAAARLDQGVGRGLLPHLTDPAQIALLLVRVLQQQPERREEEFEDSHGSVPLGSDC